MKLDNLSFYLLGRHLGHSYSTDIHKNFGYDYKLKEIEPNFLGSFLKAKNFNGLNVTIPYKQDVIPFLDKLDNSAKLIGAVNTIKNENDVLCGYNTDIYGIEYLLKKHNIIIENKKVIILGTGGASKTLQAYAKSHNAKDIVIIGRKTSPYNYKNIDMHHRDTEIIFNATPVGMYPNNGKTLIDLSPFEKLESVVDLIYNPLYTDILLQAKKLKLNYANGLSMLVAQAKKSRDIFIGDKIDNKIINKITKNIIIDKQNIVLIGMPASGKSTIGKLLGDKLGKKFVDTDLEIEKQELQTPSNIINTKGEKYFREVESNVVKQLGKNTNQIIATGGGTIINKNAYTYLKQNGIIIWIKRDFDVSATQNRPLSKDINKYNMLYNARKDLYKQFADITINNNCDIAITLEKILEKIRNYEDFSY